MHPTPSPWTPLAGASHAVALEVLLRGPLPRSELARRLNLSAGSLTRIAKPLLDSGLLVEAGTSHDARSGRPTRPLDVVPASHHFLGAKVTGEAVHAVLTNLRAEVIGTAEAELPGSTPADVVATVRRLADDLTAGLTAEGRRITGAGVSVGGPVADHATVIKAPFLDWAEDVPLGALLSDALGVPATVDNDLLALTRAEHWFGTALDHDRFAVLTIGAGVGYGLVMHDRVVDSPDAGVGLVGHFPLDPLGPLCPEGHRGCAVAMLSIPSICAAISVGLCRSVTYDECLDLAADGDPVAAAVVRAAGSALGRLIAAVANLTLTQKIVLTGEGIRLAEVARAAIDEAVRRDRDPRARELSLEIQPIDFSEWARGAAAAAIQGYVLGGSPAPRLEF
ncbi:ROK family transcriptional regulator [Streptomyces hirsutus]|uniref:ROK family transcriptional regulator n=1 Tax=Streptomyces hirsutus TaxID=35620 RepID=A0ABZ1GTC1_9ACTN|nr:ROK family transcriptional regulator [Streptomyces hirsutus]WSD09447.1 ROK family transcriptional regulator [Streptomyces hirsutus]WTD17101.1 ROK family transcriptional regulator [Streptomyces hirsutus]